MILLFSLNCTWNVVGFYQKSIAKRIITKVSEVLCEMLFLLRGKFGEADILVFCDA